MSEPTQASREAFNWEEAKQRLAGLASTLKQIEQLAPDQARLLMDQRARELARVEIQAADEREVVEILRFQLGDEPFAVETKYVHEVVRWREPTPIPGAPAFVVGLVNLRGEMLAVIDLRTMFGVAAEATSESTRLIVMGDARIEFTIRADAVVEVVTISRDEVQEAPPGTATGIAQDLLSGVTRDALLVIDGKALLQDQRLYIDQSD